METRVTAQSARALAPSVRLSELMHRVKQQPFPVAGALEVIVQAAELLKKAWEEGRPSVEVEPDALWVSSLLQVRLEAPREPSAGKFSIRRRYQSPEVKNGLERSEESDVYSLAALLFELLTGTSVLNAVLHSPAATSVPAPSTLNPAVPAELDAVLLAAVSFDVRQRTPQLSLLLEGLRKALPNTGEGTSVPRDFWAQVYPDFAPAHATTPRLRVLPSPTEEPPAPGLGTETPRPRPTLTVVIDPAATLEPVLTPAAVTVEMNLPQAFRRLPTRVHAFALQALTLWQLPSVRKAAPGVAMGFLVGLLSLFFFSSETPPSAASLGSLRSSHRILDESLTLSEFKPVSAPVRSKRDASSSRKPEGRKRRARSAPGLPWFP